MAIYSGFTHEKWWFSIVMWLFTRGYLPKCRKPMKTISPMKVIATQRVLAIFKPDLRQHLEELREGLEELNHWQDLPRWSRVKMGVLRQKKYDEKMMKIPMISHDNHKKPRDSIGHSFWPPISQSSTGLSEAETRPAKRPDPNRPRSSQRRPRLEIRHVPPKKKKKNKKRLEIVLNSDGSNTKPWLLKRVFNIHFNIRGKWFIII